MKVLITTNLKDNQTLEVDHKLQNMLKIINLCLADQKEKIALNEPPIGLQHVHHLQFSSMFKFQRMLKMKDYVHVYFTH